MSERFSLFCHPITYLDLRLIFPWLSNHQGFETGKLTGSFVRQGVIDFAFDLNLSLKPGYRRKLIKRATSTTDPGLMQPLQNWWSVILLFTLIIELVLDQRNPRYRGKRHRPFSVLVMNLYSAFSIWHIRMCFSSNWLIDLWVRSDISI